MSHAERKAGVGGRCAEAAGGEGGPDRADIEIEQLRSLDEGIAGVDHRGPRRGQLERVDQRLLEVIFAES
jgi:hypothetical protein